MPMFLRRPDHLALCVVSTLLVVLCVPSALAQVAAPAPQGAIRLLITPSNGEQAISKDQLTASFDKRPIEIQDVVPAKSEPIVFAILIDISGSSKENELFERQSALDIFRALAVGTNTAFFGDFNDELYLSHKPASLNAVLKELKDMGPFRGGTALYDAVLAAARLVNREAKGTNSRRAVFVLTDGNDNASRLNLNELIPTLQREGVPVFCIGLLGQESPEKAPDALRKISDSTGAVPHLFTRPTDYMPTLLSEIENQYWLTLSSPATADGKLHSLTVKNDRKSLQITAPGAVLAR